MYRFRRTKKEGVQEGLQKVYKKVYKKAKLKELFKLCRII